MSKASDYAQRVQSAKEVPFLDLSIHPKRVASVAEDGWLFLERDSLDPGSALALAGWILETFGEPKAKNL